ncbi:Mss4-like protein [Xylariales sp. PMI_506]|nr:Mss4-like protein [Xylariales sp. PMI_506]
MSSPQDFPKPKFITGGCLCGALRYRVDYPENYDFLSSSSTCQCTQDRKCTGSLWFQSHDLQPSTLFRWTSPTASLKDYSASPTALRGFCTGCGSFLYWKPVGSDDDAGAEREGQDRICIAVGSVDPLYLFGEGADGVEVPEGGFGFALANGGGRHLWCDNEIKGVTDKLPILGYERGTRWALDSTP